MTRPRLLDLFCGAGATGMGFHRAGFDVVGYDIDPQPDYPFEFHQGSALDALVTAAQDFDAISAGCPCQKACTLTKGNEARQKVVGRKHHQWIPATRALLELTGKPYVIENVPGAPIRRDLTLCGEMFGLGVQRHRYFELGGWSMPNPKHKPHRGRTRGWRHGEYFDGPYVAVYGDGGGKATVGEAREAMGIDWMTELHDLVEAIPPAYSEFVGHGLMAALTGQQVAA
jgi:DNA (cytosine-5)-methyltransferase 1